MYSLNLKALLIAMLSFYWILFTEIVLDISSKVLKLSFKDQYSLNLALPYAVDDDNGEQLCVLGVFSDCLTVYYIPL